MHNERPTFYTDKGQPIRAAGILCYVIHKNNNKLKKIWLFRNQNNYYSDTGGKTDKEDKSIIDTAIRETVEETNGHLFSHKHDFQTCRKILVDEFKKQKPKPLYVDNCKYLVFPLKLMYKNKYLSLKRFGKKELHDNLEHSYKWLSYVPKNLHPRLNGVKSILINDKIDNQNFDNQKILNK